MKKFAKVIAMATALMTPLVFGQSAITKAVTPYVAQPDIKFSIQTAATARTQAVPSQVVTPAVTPTPAIAPVAAMEIEKGKRVDQQLITLGARSGWTLIWEAPDYVLDHSVSLRADFESSVAVFLAGANESGSRLRATFYRGNKTVRITEF